MEILASTLLVLLVWREYENKYIIKDLLDRLMAKDFNTYKIMTRKPNNVKRALVLNDEELAKREQLQKESRQENTLDGINDDLERHLKALSTPKAGVA